MLATIELSLSNALRLLLRRVATDKKLPFASFIHNAETIAAMRAAEAGDLVTVGSIEQLFADLNTDDTGVYPDDHVCD